MGSDGLTAQLFGPYRIVRLLGRGGMGSVYLAERADGEFRQQVALKVLASHLVEDSFAERFRQERQLLAQLQHPHIVSFVDGGLDHRGQPYLVTEYIGGLPLGQYCEARQPSLRARLALFLEIASAVAYAHQNLIVHRDLKPSNILVTADGHAKLLDFGTAKLLDAAGEKTATHAHLLTPRYASPEQLRNEPVSTRSDIYSLGLVLYEMLSGARAFSTTGEAISELARAYQFTAPTPLSPKLPRDLRSIVYKALEHQPQDRYSSAAEFSRDIERFLDGRPVAARPASAFYVASKYIARHRFAAIAAALLLVAVSVGVWTTFRERDRAQRRFNQVRQLAKFQLFDLFDEASSLLGTTRLQATLAEEALRYLDSLSQEDIDDQSLRVELAEGYTRIGDLLGNYSRENLGDPARAKQSLSKARTLLQGLQAPAASLHLDFVAALSDYSSGVDPKGSLARLQAAAEGLEKVPRKDITSILRLGRAYAAVARALQAPNLETASVDLSEAWISKARDVYDQGLASFSSDRRLLHALHSLCASRSIWIADTKPNESLRWNGEAEMYALQLKGEQNNPDFLMSESRRHSGRAAALRALSRNAEALEESERSVAFLALIARDENNRTAPINHAIGLINLAQMQYDLDRAEDHIATCEKAHRIMEEQFRISPQQPVVANFYQRTLFNLAWAYTEFQRPEAAATLEKSFALFRSTAAKEPKNTSVREHLTDLLLNLRPKGYDDAEEGHRYSLELVALEPQSLTALDALARSQELLGRFADSAATIQKALDIVGEPKAGEAPGALRTKFQKRRDSLLASAAGSADKK